MPSLLAIPPLPGLGYLRAGEDEDNETGEEEEEEQEEKRNEGNSPIEEIGDEYFCPMCYSLSTLL